MGEQASSRPRDRKKENPCEPASGIEFEIPEPACQADDTAEPGKAAAPLFWYATDDQEQPQGPVSTGELLEMIARGHLLPDHMVWRKDWNQWQPLRDVFPPDHLATITTSTTSEQLTERPSQEAIDWQIYFNSLLAFFRSTPWLYSPLPPQYVRLGAAITIRLAFFVVILGALFRSWETVLWASQLFLFAVLVDQIIALQETFVQHKGKPQEPPPIETPFPKKGEKA